MAGVKIKKPKQKAFSNWDGLSTLEKSLIIIPSALVVVLLVVLICMGTKNSNQPKVEVTTNGKWHTMEGVGVNIWAPKDLPDGDVYGGLEDYEYTLAQRDKGGYPEISFGTIVAPDGTYMPGELDIKADPAGVLDVTTPLLHEAFADMMKGVSPVLSTDVVVVSRNGMDILEAEGEGTATVAFHDPKTDEDYAEDMDTKLFYSVALLEGRPVVVWGTWDWSTYEGEKRTKDSVRDAIDNLIVLPTANVAEPSEEEPLE